MVIKRGNNNNDLYSGSQHHLLKSVLQEGPENEVAIQGGSTV